MGLLLKSLKQIDWRPAEAPAEDELAPCADLAPAIEEAAGATEAPFGLDEPQPCALEPTDVEDTVLDVEPEAQAEEVEPPASAPPEPKEPEIQTTESTLDRLNELHHLIDAALEEISGSKAIVVESPAGDATASQPAIAFEQLEGQDRIVDFSPVEASPATVVPPPVIPEPVILPVPVILNPPKRTAPVSRVPAVKIRDEYRELRDHLLARFRLDEPGTLLAIDAGRVAGDASWMAPFAACLWESLSEEPALHLSVQPRILLVEAAGPQCGIARHLGLDCPKGLAEVLHGSVDLATAIQPTYHPQIDLLGLGATALGTKQSEQLTRLWSDLERRYQAILVAAGPWEAPGQASWRKTGIATAAILLPLADAAVVCVELEGTPQSVAIETKQALQRRGVRLLGCVVNGR